INGLVNNEFYIPAASLQFAGIKEFLDAYQKRAPGLGIDPLGFTYPPYAYAAGQILAKAVSETKSLDDERLAEYIRGHAIDTVIGPMSFGEDGEWKTPRIMYAQFQNVSGNDIGQFKDMSRQIVVWPAQLKTGELIYPYAQALKCQRRPPRAVAARNERSEIGARPGCQVSLFAGSAAPQPRRITPHSVTMW